MEHILIITIGIFFLCFCIYNLRYLFLAQAEHKQSKRANKSYYQSYLILPLSFFITFALYLPATIIAIYFTNIAKGFLNLDNQILASLPISIDMFSIGAGAIITVLFSGRLGGFRVVLGAGLILSIIGMLGSALANNAPSLIFFRVFYGLGYCGCIMGFQQFVLASAKNELRSLRLSQIYTGIFQGILCGCATGGAIASLFSYKAVFVCSGILLFICLCYVYYLFKSRVVDKSIIDNEHSLSTHFSIKGALSFFSSIRVMGVLLLQVVPYGVIAVGFFDYYIPVFLHSKSYSPTITGFISMIYSLTVILTSAYFGKIMQRLKRKFLLLLVGSFALALAPLCFYINEPLLACALCMFLLGIGSSVNEGGQMSVIASYEEKDKIGLNEAVNSVDVFMRLGQFIGPIIVTTLVHFFATLNYLILSLMCFIIIVLFIISQVCFNKDIKYKNSN